MNHKNKTKVKVKVQRIDETLNTLRNNDPLIETNDHNISVADPFSFEKKPLLKNSVEVAQSVTKGIEQVVDQNRSINNTIMDNIKKTAKHCASSASDNISDSMEVMNANTVLTERVFNNMNSAISKSIEINSNLSKDLLKCKDVTDVIQFQQKALEQNFSNIMNFCLDMGFAIQSCASKNVQVMMKSSDHYAKCFTGEMI